MARWAAFAALAVAVIEACGNSDDSTTNPFNGPPDITIGALNELSCDDSLVVTLTLTNWNLRPPGYCGTSPQCGSVEVALLETADGAPLLPPTRAATTDVQLDLSALVSPATPAGPTLSQVHYIKAQLLGDSLQPYVLTGAGHASQVCGADQVECPVSVAFSAPTGCSSEGGSSAGLAGAAGANAGSTSAPGGQGGEPNAGGAGGAPETGAGGEVASAGAAPL